MHTATIEATFESGTKRVWQLLLNHQTGTYHILEYSSFSKDDPRPIVFRRSGQYGKQELAVARPKLINCICDAENVYFNGNLTPISLVAPVSS